MRGGRGGGGGPATVYLHVYDLHGANQYTHWVGLGAYHCGVEVGGIEYSFAGGAGIFCMTPKQAPGAIYRETIVMGETTTEGTAAISRAIQVLRPEFGPDDYHILQKNCNAFANRLCIELVGKGVPGWCNRLASFGSFFSCFLPRELTQEAPVNQDPNTGGVAAFPPVNRYVGNGSGNGGGGGGGGGYRAFSGEGMRASAGAGAGAGAGASGGGSKGEAKESEAERREKIRQATLARMAAANGPGAPSSSAS